MGRPVGIAVAAAAAVLVGAAAYWLLQARPTPGALSDVDAMASNDAWAVGYEGPPLTTQDRALVERWDGSTWRRVACPGPLGSTLQAVTVISARDAWAVGGVGLDALIEHWDGRRWTRVASPHAGGTPVVLTDVSAASDRDVWAVGSRESEPTGDTPLVEHWDGSTWSVVTTPRLGSASLSGVAALSPYDVWTVGGVVGTDGRVGQPLVEHWDGRQWRRVPAPSTLGGNNDLRSVSAASPTDIWAVGANYKPGFGPTEDTLVEHWDGTAWAIVPSPRPAPYGGELSAVAALSATDVWAVGDYNDTNGSGTGVSDGGGTSKALLMHWNGRTWSRSLSHDPGGANSGWGGIAAVSSTDLWAVGWSGGRVASTSLSAR